jgi:drug/metabolite transporter (DMT)-like permease
MNRRAATMAAYAGLSLICGSAWIGRATLAGHIPPLLAEALRFSFGAALAGAMAAALRSRWPRGSALRASLLLGITLGALPNVLVLWGGQRTPAVLPTLLFGAVPLLAGWMGSSSRFALQAALVGLGGLALILSNGLSLPVDALGAIAILAAVACHAWSIVYARRFLRDPIPAGYGSIPAFTAVQLAVAAAATWLLSVGLERGQPWQWSRDAGTAIVLLGALGAGVGLALYNQLLRLMEPVAVATLQWMLPIVAIAEGALLERALPPGSVLLGSGVVLGCIWGVTRAKFRSERPVTLQVTGAPMDESEPKIR